MQLGTGALGFCSLSSCFNREDSVLLKQTIEKFSVLLEESGNIGRAEPG
jgi:hypothetical protein